MATANQNLSDYNPDSVPSARGMRFAIVVSEWNRDVTLALLEGARTTLIRHEADPEHIEVEFVPGSFELTSGAKTVAETHNFDAVICIGCVVRGETPHFDYICQGVTYGITRLNIEFDIPFIFGVLTTESQQQALDRAGGKYGNKGDEAAVTAIKMVALKRKSSGIG